MSAPRRHHYVPQVLLKNFAGPDGKLRVFGIDHDTEFFAATTNFAHVTGGHDRINPDGTTDMTTLERRMSDLEGKAAAEIRNIRESTKLTISPDDYPTLPWLASLQHSRNRAIMGYIKSELVKGGDVGEDEPYLQTAILDVTVRNLLDAWDADTAGSVQPEDSYNYFVVALRTLRWDVMRYREPRLVVTDSFAAQRGIAAEFEEQLGVPEKLAHHGLHVPPHAAASFTITLAPDLALHLHRGTDRKYIPAEQVNQRSIYNARSFVAMPSSWNLPYKPAGLLEEWISTSRFVRGMLAASM